MVSFLSIFLDSDGRGWGERKREEKRVDLIRRGRGRRELKEKSRACLSTCTNKHSVLEKKTLLAYNYSTTLGYNKSFQQVGKKYNIKYKYAELDQL